ncbi:hypothetical protein [Streptomyces sp. NPDC058279]|uniref:hypothetical protein n=1 Tax=Streptomyces sp. NPDC058279 TaxID=3346418 RepID=UPI0036F12E6B
MNHSKTCTAADVLRGLLAPPRAHADADAEATTAPGLTALRVIEETRPARTVGAGVTAAGGAHGEAAIRLRELTGSHLTGRPDRWLGLHDALATHRGTLPVLLADVPPPAPVPGPDEVRPPAPRSVHATLALLLEHTRPEDAAGAPAALPDRTVEALLSTGSLPGPHLVAAVIEHGDSRTRTALARHSRLDARVLARLLALGDPRVGAAVYRNPRCTPSLRRTLAHRLDRIPMDPGLRAELTDPTGNPPSTWLTPLLGCGDPQLTARALPHAGRGAAERYALVRVWECAGPAAVRALLDDRTLARLLSRPVVAAVGKALADDTGSGEGAALRRLREGCESYEDPARLPALLATTRGTSSLRDLLCEPYAHDLPALAEAHAATPFMPKACEELARHEDASDEQRLAFRLSVLNEPWRAGGRRSGNTHPPEQRLAREALDDSAARWAEGMVAAGLLDPAELVRTAHPAVHALDALTRLADRGLLGEDAPAALRAPVEAHLGERAEAWNAVNALLPGHQGTLLTLLAEAGDSPSPGPAPTAVPTGPCQDTAAHTGQAASPRVVPDPATGSESETETETETEPIRSGSVRPAPPEPVGVEPPRAPGRPEERAALAGLDLLRSLAVAPDEVPLPTDPGVLRFLADHRRCDAPGLATPAWLVRACADHGVEPSHDGVWHSAPTLAEVRAERPESWGSSAVLTEEAYTQGILPAEELPALLPADRLLRLPYDWRRLAFAHAWRAAVARLLRSELGTDPEGWLRLAETASAAAGLVGRRAADGPTWVELLELSARPADVSAGMSAYRPLDQPAQGFFRPRPTTPDEAIALLGRGDHGWTWPIGTLLCLAEAETVDAVLARLGPDGSWLLAAYLLRHERTPRTVFDRLLAGRDPHALRVLAAQSRWLEDGADVRLADLDDPEVDLTLLRNGTTARTALRIVTRSRSGSPAGSHPRPGARAVTVGVLALAEVRRNGSATPPPGGSRWLYSAEPDLIEEVFARQGADLSLLQQILGCLNLLRHGGTDRLTALVRRDLLGRAATTLCVKALASADPAAVLRARVARELAPAKLIARLRRDRPAWQNPGGAASVPGGIDWEAVEAAHAHEPLPHWDRLVNHHDAPADLRLRHAALVREPGADGLPDGADLTRARARHGLGGLFHCPPAVQLDGLLGSGMLTATDLLHQAAPAALMLAYLAGAARRTDAPEQARAALTALTDLVAGHLGTDPQAWRRVTDRLTGRDPGWDHLSPVAALLT